MCLGKTKILEVYGGKIVHINNIEFFIKTSIMKNCI